MGTLVVRYGLYRGKQEKKKTMSDEMEDKQKKILIWNKFNNLLKKASNPLLSSQRAFDDVASLENASSQTQLHARVPP